MSMNINDCFLTFVNHVNNMTNKEVRASIDKANELAARCSNEEEFYIYEPRGEWVINFDNPDTYICSLCKSNKRGNQPFFKNLWRYCPNCGARMKGV